MTGKDNDPPKAQDEYSQYLLGQSGNDRIVFYRQYSESGTTKNFIAGAFKKILMIWVEQASTTDTQSQRTTLTGYTNTSWTTINGYKHRINIIGIK